MLVNFACELTRVMNIYDPGGLPSAFTLELLATLNERLFRFR